jgi:hypothetical protein
MEVEVISLHCRTTHLTIANGLFIVTLVQVYLPHVSTQCTNIYNRCTKTAHAGSISNASHLVSVTTTYTHLPVLFDDLVFEYHFRAERPNRAFDRIATDILHLAVLSLTHRSTLKIYGNTSPCQVCAKHYFSHVNLHPILLASGQFTCDLTC